MGYLRAYERDPLRPDLASVALGDSTGFGQIIEIVARKFTKCLGQAVTARLVPGGWVELGPGNGV
jgi:hypothetical protein